MPSKKILKKIGWDGKHHRQYSIFPKETIEEGLVSYFGGLCEQIRDFYNTAYEINPENIAMQPVIAGWEALKNAWTHGSKKYDYFIYGLFMGKKGICHGLQDKGDYFKNLEIKKQYEQKRRVKKFNKNIGEFHIGTNISIFPLSDLIEVDTDKGILYCAQDLKRLLK